MLVGRPRVRRSNRSPASVSLVEANGGHVTQTAQVHRTRALHWNSQVIVVGDHLRKKVKDRLRKESQQIAPPVAFYQDSELLATHLRHRLVVDSNQIPRLWVDLETAVESQSGFKVARGVGAELLAHGDLVQKVGLLLLDAGREAHSLGLVDRLSDSRALVQGFNFCLHLCGARLLALVAPQLSSELGLASSRVVEVYGVG